MNDTIVLIPHYNDLTGLYKTLASIYGNVDIIIIDDGSKIKPDAEKIKREFTNLSVVYLIIFEVNKGLVQALNTGLKFIVEKGYKYIARLDAGDICIRDRFIIQRNFFENNPDIYLVGSWAVVIDKEGKELFIRKYPISHNEIYRKMYLFSSFMHPTVMYRTEALSQVGFYPNRTCEDISFFFKFIRCYKAANIPEVLLQYELNPHGYTYSNYRKIQLAVIRIIIENFKLKYLFYFLLGLLRRVINLLLGPKIMMKIGMFLRKRSFHFKQLIKIK